MRLPAHWKQAELGDLLERPPQYGVNCPSVAYVEGVTPRLIRITDINGDGELIDEPRVGVLANEATGRMVTKGDLLLARSGATVGKSLVVGDLGYPAAFAGYLIRFRIDERKAALGFVKQFLSSERYWQWVRKTLRAGAQPNINSEEFCSLVVPLPESQEQTTLRRLLDSWDKCVWLCERLISANGERKRGLMQRLLTGKARFSEFKTERWRTVRIGDLLEPKNRYEEWDDERRHRLAGVRRNGGGLFFRDELAGSQIKVKVCKKIKTGDFLISRRQMTYGGMAMVPPEFDGFDVNDEYEVLVVREGADFDMRFFGYLSEMPELKHAAYVASNGFFAERLRLNLDLDEFLSHRIAVPPSGTELRKIVTVLDAATCEIELLRKRLAALKEQKRGLMQKLLTGEIRVNVNAEGGAWSEELPRKGTKVRKERV